MNVGETKEVRGKSRNYRVSDVAALVSILCGLLLVGGTVGHYYINQHTIVELTKSSTDIKRRLRDIELEVAKRGPRIDRCEEIVKELQGRK